MFVLIHSPLVGTFTWSRVEREMEKRGFEVVAPRLLDDGRSPFWKQEAEAVRAELERTPEDASLILVGHSGAGPLLPAIAKYSPRTVIGYVFVDAGILWKDASRLEMFVQENAEFAREFEEELARGATFPNWSAEDLREIVPDDETRRRLAEDLKPRGLDFFQETLPAFSFPDAPCAYLHFSPPYATPAREARERGWKFRQMDAGHFHMLVEPESVTDAILDLTREMHEGTAR